MQVPTSWLYKNLQSPRRKGHGRHSNPVNEGGHVKRYLTSLQLTPISPTSDVMDDATVDSSVKQFKSTGSRTPLAPAAEDWVFLVSKSLELREILCPLVSFILSSHILSFSCPVPWPLPSFSASFIRAEQLWSVVIIKQSQLVA